MPHPMCLDGAAAPGAAARTGIDRGSAAWAAVASLSLGVFGLVAAEFLRADLLKPIAGDLAVSGPTAPLGRRSRRRPSSRRARGRRGALGPAGAVRGLVFWGRCCSWRVPPGNGKA